jgi:hypothetical protein
VGVHAQAFGSTVSRQYSVHSESSHTPLLFPHFVVLQSGIKMDLIVIFGQQYTQNTLMSKWKKNV